MRRICYHVAMSLDGYIAGPNGEFDWIVTDPDIDFVALFPQFDTLLSLSRFLRREFLSGRPEAFDARCCFS